MIISHKHKFISFACGKTGTHSIEKAIKKYHDGHEITRIADAAQQKLRDRYSLPFNLRHIRPALAKALIDPEIWNSYYKFVFVRNPWAWVLSNYCFNHPRLIRHLNRFEAVHVNLVWHLMKIHNQSFHTESYFQHTFVYDESGAMLVDFYGRLESIQDDFNLICSKTGIRQKRLKKKNTTDHRPYRDLYTDEARDLVAELYRKDIELFGYSF